MRSTTKLAAFVLVLAAVFGVGAAIGAAAGPIDVGGLEDEMPVDTTVEVPDTHEGH